MKDNLPKLTYKQQKFIINYFNNEKNASEAYRQSYNCNMSTEAINVEASKLLKNPKVSLWIEYYEKNLQEFIEQEINYSVDDAFKEFETLQDTAMNSFDKYGNPNINAAIKIIENKCKLKGLLKDIDVNNSVVVAMPDVVIDDIPLNLNVGESTNEHIEASGNS